MDHTWPVEVVDDAGSPVTGARVCLVESSSVTDKFPYPGLAATHDDKGGGKYEPKAPIVPSEGKWILVVHKKGKAPVAQPLTLKKKGKEEHVASPRPGAVATVTLTATTRTVGGSKVKETAFKVKLHPAAELVFIGGVDYHRQDISKGWLFHLYGFYRAEVLRREKKIHAGTIVTVFSPAKGTRTTRVVGSGGKWVEVEVAKMGDISLRVIPPAPDHYVPVVGTDIHVTDFYKYLAEVGKREPKSVKEIGIFSHSYPGGPILYNTGQGAYSSRPERNPDDFDARIKDFNATNMAGYKELKDALTADCRFTVWGCSATTHYKNRSVKALEAIEKGKGEDEMFSVFTSYDDDDHGGVYLKDEERTSELRHRWAMDVRFRDGTYPAAAAKALGIEVRSACPGCGSDPTTVEGIEMLGVNLKTYARVYKYFHKRFAPEFAETKGKWDLGYLDYKALQSRPAVPKPAFTSAYYHYSVRVKDTPWQTKGATLTFWDGTAVDHPTAKAKLVQTETKDLVTAGKKGHLYVLEDADKTKSQAVYVQEDGKIHKVTQDAAKKWTVVGAKIN